MVETIEYLWVERNLPEKPCTIFNFGSTGDRTVELFTEKGYMVVGVDLQQDMRNMVNYKFYRGDFLKIVFEERFECVYAISTVEHAGLPVYGAEPFDLDGDIRAIRKLYDLLKPDGTLLVTVPYGLYPQSPTEWKVYDEAGLAKLVGDLEHSSTFFLAVGEYFLYGWRLLHGRVSSPLKEPPSSLMRNLYGEKALTQEMAEKTCSIACIKFWRR